MTQFGNMPAYPFHVDIVNVKRVTMSRLESTVIVTIEVEDECILFYQMGNTLHCISNIHVFNMDIYSDTSNSLFDPSGNYYNLASD